MAKYVVYLRGDSEPKIIEANSIAPGKDGVYFYGANQELVAFISAETISGVYKNDVLIPVT